MKYEPAKISIGLASAAAIMLAGCGGSGSGSGDATGFLSLGVSDGPIHDATEICVVFDEVEVKGEGPAELIELDNPEQINLLDFQGMNAAPLLVQNELPVGDYQWIRLGVDAVRGGSGGTGEPLPGSMGCSYGGSYIATESGATYNLYVPSGANNGLKIVSGFTIAQGGTTRMIAEIDLQKSITAPPGLSPDAILRPAIRLVNEVEVGSLTGTVAETLATSTDAGTGAACEPSVFVFADGVTPNPIGEDGSGAEDALATAMVNETMLESGGVEYRFTVGYLTEGEYDAAFTCDGENFDLSPVEDVTIAIDTVTEIVFEDPSA